MNYRCNECGEEFDTPDYVREYHGDYTAPPEVWAVCPACRSADFEEIVHGGES